MHLLYCDETNLEPRTGDFFVYGGIAVSDASALEITKDIDQIRTRRGVPAEYQLKFNPGPEGWSHDDFIALKRDVINSAIARGTKLFTSLILHDIATSADDARRNEINRVCYHFHSYLTRMQSHGLVLIDRFDDGQVDAHLAEKFSVGVTGLPYSPQFRLSNIIGFHYSAIGQAHLPSVIDIILGSLRYSINGFTRNDPRVQQSARRILPLLSPLFFRENGQEAVSELGMFLSPREIRVDRYRNIYTGLREFLATNGIILV